MKTNGTFSLLLNTLLAGLIVVILCCGFCLIGSGFSTLMAEGQVPNAAVALAVIKIITGGGLNFAGGYWAAWLLDSIKGGKS